MIRYYEVYETKEEAEKMMENTYKFYHPAGYGTNLRVHQSSDGKWIMSGSRYSSCD